MVFDKLLFNSSLHFATNSLWRDRISCELYLGMPFPLFCRKGGQLTGQPTGQLRIGNRGGTRIAGYTSWMWPPSRWRSLPAHTQMFKSQLQSEGTMTFGSAWPRVHDLRTWIVSQQTQNLNVTFPESPLKVSSLWTYFGHFGYVRINHAKIVLSHNVL